ncbi:MAG: thiolase family protein [Candidatus Eisenbacteria bacterium]|nr:thiolase family protein [Candidatus Eisenbacteria bacterium]
MIAKDKIAILGGARTPMAEWQTGRRGDGKSGGLFAGLSALDLGAAAAKGALARTGVATSEIDHVVMGNALQTSGDALYGARHVALRAGLDPSVPALTVNRLCGSGIQALVSAAQMMLLGEAKVTIAGGMENLSQAPHVIRGLRAGLRLGHAPLEDMLMVSLLDTTCGLLMAQTAEKLARRFEISRQAQDEFALLSQQRAGKAQAAGYFREEIAPVTVAQGKNTVEMADDDHLKADSTMAGLSALPAVFSKDGFVTAGNASGIVDGGCALVLAREDALAGRRPLGRILGWTSVGVEPSEMGIGPAPAIRKLCDEAGLKVAAIDRFEINEAFAAQYLAVERDLELDRNRVNVNGGAIALGHPLGATGARLVLTLLHELRRSGGGRGIASACIGGGQGIAMLVEA